MATASERLNLLLNALIGAFNRWADRIGPADKDKSIHQAIADGFKDAGKWQSLQLDEIRAGFKMVAEAIAKGQTQPPPLPKLEVRFVFKVPNNHPDEPFAISIGGVTDAEGEPLPDASGLTVEVASSDDAVVSATFNQATNEGVAHFGHSGVASLTASVKNAAGDILGSGAANFTVTTGDPAAVSDVSIAFSGLTEEP
jgi:hypothetical protein